MKRASIWESMMKTFFIFRNSRRFSQHNLSGQNFWTNMFLTKMYQEKWLIRVAISYENSFAKWIFINTFTKTCQYLLAMSNERAPVITIFNCRFIFAVDFLLGGRNYNQFSANLFVLLEARMLQLFRITSLAPVFLRSTGFSLTFFFCQCIFGFKNYIFFFHRTELNGSNFILKFEANQKKKSSLCVCHFGKLFLFIFKFHQASQFLFSLSITKAIYFFAANLSSFSFSECFGCHVACCGFYSWSASDWRLSINSTFAMRIFWWENINWQS